MNEVNKMDFTITETSLNKLNDIITKMEHKTFHNHYHIIHDIIESYDEKNIIYLEIGAFAGGSASLVSSNQKVSKVISIDIGYPVNKEVPIRNVNTFKHNECDYHYIEGDSTLQTTIDELKSLTDNVDILFIDGDHSYNGVMNDFFNYKDFVKKGGYIIFDDYLDSIHSPEVKPSVDNIVNLLDQDEYVIIGSLVYPFLDKTNSPELISNNLYVIKKK